MVHYNKCPLCSSENISSLLDTADHFLSKEPFTLYTCTGCGFVFTQDHPEEDEIGRYYESEDYLSHSESKHNLLSRIYRFSRGFMLKKKVRLVQKISGINNGSILDIGSGSGYFASAMKKAGWDVRGIEINEKARHLSVTAFGLDVADPRQIKDLKAGSFDCITLWHVLEHFRDPFGYAGEIRRLLKPEGVCIIALPNCNSHDATYYGAYWAAWDVPRHLWHFTPETLRRFASQNGFELVNTLPLPLDVFYISVLSEKYKGANLHFMSGMIKGLWFWLLALFSKQKSSSLIYVLRKRPPGSSL